jgi:hypothetical protein
MDYMVAVVMMLNRALGPEALVNWVVLAGWIVVLGLGLRLAPAVGSPRVRRVGGALVVAVVLSAAYANVSEAFVYYWPSFFWPWW